MPSKLSMAPPKSAILRLHCCTRIFIEYGQQHQKNTPFYVYIDYWTLSKVLDR